MKTRFQISMQRASPALTSAPWVSPDGVRSTCSSEQGPHGPVSPIIQKLSFLLPGTIWILGSRPAAANFLAQYIADSWSAISNGEALGLGGRKSCDVIART